MLRTVTESPERYAVVSVGVEPESDVLPLYVTEYVAGGIVVVVVVVVVVVLVVVVVVVVVVDAGVDVVVVEGPGAVVAFAAGGAGWRVLVVAEVEDVDVVDSPATIFGSLG